MISLDTLFGFSSSLSAAQHDDNQHFIKPPKWCCRYINALAIRPERGQVMKNVMFDDFVLHPVQNSSESEIESDYESISTDSLSDNDRKQRRKRGERNCRDSLELSMSMSMCLQTLKEVTPKSTALDPHLTKLEPEKGAKQRSECILIQKTETDGDTTCEDVSTGEEKFSEIQNPAGERKISIPAPALPTCVSRIPRSSFFVNAGNNTPSFSQDCSNRGVEVSDGHTPLATHSGIRMRSSLVTERYVELQKPKQRTIGTDFGVAVGPIRKSSSSRAGLKKQNRALNFRGGDNYCELQYSKSNDKNSESITSDQMHVDSAEKKGKVQADTTVMSTSEGQCFDGEISATTDEISLRMSLDRLDGELKRLTTNIESRAAVHKGNTLVTEDKSHDDRSTLLASNNCDGVTDSDNAAPASLSLEGRARVYFNATPFSKRISGGIRKHRLRRSKIV
uniref:AlNc14C1G77 protein n=1 Tax=Albugo laibachii Nc14 TaxID=890382 RepID=F0VYS5_9STRA|nr:AlNc14C1G77 [Albugo laibachii Nc14]|eukprot:CCA13940.1 AlNc14C1G77 [Albugo laibachii Nc14]